MMQSAYICLSILYICETAASQKGSCKLALHKEDGTETKKIQVDLESLRSIEQFEDNHTFKEFEVENEFNDDHVARWQWTRHLELNEKVTIPFFLEPLLFFKRN